jgi:hypothetical protein
MNKSPIETARDVDLRLSPQALQRAAQRARELAARTGTAIVITRHGVIEHIRPPLQPGTPLVQEPPAGYGDKA